tara:strand:- start:165 stop:1067 length:903 start_codon:yes stop_codon:yes gene_type:complete
MQKKICPVCDTNQFSKKVYDKKLPVNINNANFAGRKNPDGYHYEMLRCDKCTLLYASEIYDEEYSNLLYNESSFDYSSELNGLTKSYSKALAEGIKLLNNSKENFLEIGCGNGFMLKEASKLGFRNVKGIEPSKEAITFADDEIKNFIVHGVFDESYKDKTKYDLVFIAMIIEHVVDSTKFLKDIYDILKPGGIIVCICHNERHFLSKILKAKHPIINDEHVAVFNKKALSLIFKKNNYTDINIKNLKNYYSLNYWIKMFPLPPFFKKIVSKTFNFVFNNPNIGLKAGNLYLIAKKMKGN